jgi:hypothetical protein
MLYGRPSTGSGPVNGVSTPFLASSSALSLPKKLAAFRDIWEMFNQQLSTQYTPGAYLTVDEQLSIYTIYEK